LTNNQTITSPFKQATQDIPMANSLINEDTGASLEYRQSKMTVHFPSGTNQQQMNLDDWYKVLEAGLKDPTQFLSSHVRQCPKER
jgi:hypothetical protein